MTSLAECAASIGFVSILEQVILNSDVGTTVHLPWKALALKGAVAVCYQASGWIRCSFTDDSKDPRRFLALGQHIVFLVFLLQFLCQKVRRLLLLGASPIVPPTVPMQEEPEDALQPGAGTGAGAGAEEAEGGGGGGGGGGGDKDKDLHLPLEDEAESQFGNFLASGSGESRSAWRSQCENLEDDEVGDEEGDGDGDVNQDEKGHGYGYGYFGDKGVHQHCVLHADVLGLQALDSFESRRDGDVVLGESEATARGEDIEEETQEGGVRNEAAEAQPLSFTERSEKADELS